jgi:hypothetical protein
MGAWWGFKRRGELPILPRKGEVAPKVTDGEDTDSSYPVRPLRLASASHLPLAGEDFSVAQSHRQTPPRRRPGSSWGTLLTRAALPYCHLSNWAPASAGVVQFRAVGAIAGRWRLVGLKSFPAESAPALPARSSPVHPASGRSPRVAHPAGRSAGDSVRPARASVRHAADRGTPQCRAR